MRKRRPTAILTSDIHLRDDQPICRLDNFWETVNRKITWLKNLQEQHNCPILDAGDLFHHWKPSPFLLRWAIENLPNNMHSVAGNHDLPNHSLDLYEKSGLAVLEAAGKLTVLKTTHLISSAVVHPFHWEEGLAAVVQRNTQLQQIALCHVMTYQGRKPYPGCTDPGASSLLKKMKGYDLVVTGHNHQSFSVEYEGRRLVNPGGLWRMSADEIDRKPSVWLWYSEDNSVEQIFVPIEEGVISREHITTKEERDDRIEAFVSKLSGDFEVGLSFEKNLEQFFSTNRIRLAVKDIVWEAVHGD